MFPTIHRALMGMALAAAAPVLGAESTDSEQAPSGEMSQRRMVDNIHQSVDDMVQSTVRSIDGFFVNSEFSTFNDKKTRVRLRLNTDYLDAPAPPEAPPLPDDQGADVDQESPADDDGNDVALRWIGKQSEKKGFSFDLGLRIKSSQLDPFGRIIRTVR